MSTLSGFKVMIQNVHVQFLFCNSIYTTLSVPPRHTCVLFRPSVLQPHPEVGRGRTEAAMGRHHTAGWRVRHRQGK